MHLIRLKCRSGASHPKIAANNVALGTLTSKPTDVPHCSTGELGYDGPLYDRFLHMTDDMLGPSPMHIKYSSYVYDGFCI